MSGDDWAVGDLALCVRVDRDRYYEPACGYPREGAPYTVTYVDEGTNDFGETMTCLLLAEMDTWPRGLPAHWFRKIRPLSDEELRQAREEMRGPEVVCG